MLIFDYCGTTLPAGVIVSINADKAKPYTSSSLEHQLRLII